MPSSKQFVVSVVLNAIDKLSPALKQAAGAVKALDNVAEQTKGLQEMSDQLKGIGERLLVVGAAAGAAVAIPVKAFADEQAKSLDAQRAFMTARGLDRDTWDRIEATAIKLGRVYNDNAEDIQQYAAHLKMAGVAVNAIGDAGLEAAEQFHKLNQDVSLDDLADTLGVIEKSLHVLPGDFGALLDQLQRVQYTFGADATDLQQALKYVVPLLAGLGIHGLAGAKSVLTLTGALRQGGLSGRLLGGGLREIISALPGLDEKIKKSADIQEQLSAKGIKLKFFDDQGQLVGGNFRNVVAQIQKLNAFDPQKKLAILQELFGPTAAAALAKLSDLGVGGLDDAAKKLAGNASLAQRAAQQTGGLADQFHGAVQAVAHLTGALGESLAPVLQQIGNVIGPVVAWLTDFIKRHQTITGLLMLNVALFAALATVLGTVAIAMFGLTSAVKYARGAWILFKTALAIGRIVASTMIETIVSLTTAMWSFTASLLANPITWIVLAIVAAVALLAFAIYELVKHWDAVKRAGIVAWDAIKHAVTAAVTWLSGIDLFAIGKQILVSLWNGLKAMVSKPVELVQSIANKIRALWPFGGGIDAGNAGLSLAPRRVDPNWNIVPPGASAAARAAAAGSAASRMRLGTGVRSRVVAGDLHVHYAPTVNIGGGASQQDRRDFKQMLADHKEELRRMVDDAHRNAQRGAFAPAGT